MPNAVFKDPCEASFGENSKFNHLRQTTAAARDKLL
jgi:hypothetical protein